MMIQTTKNKWTQVTALEHIGKWVAIIDRENTYYHKTVNKIHSFMKNALRKCI